MENLLGQIRSHLRLTGKRSSDGREIAWCPFHPDGEGKPPHQANLLLSERGFICHACGEKGSLRELADRLGIESDEATYPYEGPDGTTRYRIVRLPGKRFVAQHPTPAGGWEPGLNGAQPILYRIQDILRSSPEALIFVVEGEKDADRLARQGLVATTSPFGAGKWRSEFSPSLRHRTVVILPDNDEPGRAHARQVAASVAEHALTVKVVELPGLPKKGDVSDWLNAGHTVDELRKLAEAAPGKEVEEPGGAELEDGQPETKPADPDSKDLVRLVLDRGVELFHDQLGIPHGRFPVNGHHEIRQLKSRDFERWVARLVYEDRKRTLGREGIGSVLRVLEGKAVYDSPEYTLHTRVAHHDGAIWYDLADADWACVRITEAGWEVVRDPPILFRRFSHQRPQVIPKLGGRVDDVLPFLPPSAARLCPLILPYLASCFIPHIPHPILGNFGDGGGGKTTTAKVIKALVDPSSMEILALVQKPDQLVQQLSHHWMPFFDNVSSLKEETADILCRAATGEGYSKRSLYTDDDDFIYSYRRCVGFNVINLSMHRPDLLDRCILLEVERIEDSKRREEGEFWQSFSEQKPRILGACFGAVSHAMSIRDSVTQGPLPRMADFAAWGATLADAMDIGRREFLNAYEADATNRVATLLADNPLVQALADLLGGQREWEGPASQLSRELKRIARKLDLDIKDLRWPAAANVLTRYLNELKPSLRVAGIEYSARRTNRGSLVKLGVLGESGDNRA